MEAAVPKKKRSKHRSARRARDEVPPTYDDVVSENITDDDVTLKDTENIRRGEDVQECVGESKTAFEHDATGIVEIQPKDSISDKENDQPQHVRADLTSPMECEDSPNGEDAKPNVSAELNECNKVDSPSANSYDLTETPEVPCPRVISDSVSIGDQNASMSMEFKDSVVRDESLTNMDIQAVAFPLSTDVPRDSHPTQRDSIIRESMDISALYPDLSKESGNLNLSANSTEHCDVSDNLADVPLIYPKIQNVDANSEPVNWSDVLRSKNNVVPNAPPEELIQESKSLDLIDLSTDIPVPVKPITKKTDTLRKTIRWQSVSDNEDVGAQSCPKRRSSRSTQQWLMEENNESECSSKNAYRTYQQSSGYTSDAEIVDPASYLVRQNNGMIVLELKTLCEIHLLERIKFGNCLQLLQAANAYDSFILLSEALKVAARNFNEVWKTEAFLNLNKHDLLRLFCHSKIKGHREVVSALLYWYNHERDARTASYKMLLEELQILEVEKENEIILKPKVRKEKKDNFAVLFSPYLDSKLRAIILDLNNCEKSTVQLSKPPDMGADYAVCLSRFCCSDYFFITGGHGKDGGKKMWMYDIYHSKWKKCKSMPKDRTNHSMASVSPRVYVIGGYQNGTATANIDCFSMKSNRWKTVGKLKVPVADATCVVRRGTIYVFGGVSTDGLGLSVVQSFNVETGETAQLPDLPYVCVKARAESVKGRIYIAIETGPILRFNPETNKAQIHVKSPMKRRHFAMISDGDELIFIGGHSYESGPLRTVEKYCPSTDNWTYLGKLKTGIMSSAAVCLHYRLS